MSAISYIFYAVLRIKMNNEIFIRTDERAQYKQIIDQNIFQNYLIFLEKVFNKKKNS